MALDQSALSELLDALRAGGDLDLVRSGLQLVLQALIELEAAQAIGALPYQRSPERTTHRNGAPRAPALDQGRRPGAADPQAALGLVLPLAAGAAPAHRPGPVGGGDGGLRPRGARPARSTTWCAPSASTPAISKSEVSRICAELDEHVGAFRDRRSRPRRASPTCSWMRPT